MQLAIKGAEDNTEEDFTAEAGVPIYFRDPVHFQAAEFQIQSPPCSFDFPPFPTFTRARGAS